MEDQLIVSVEALYHLCNTSSEISEVIKDNAKNITIIQNKIKNPNQNLSEKRRLEFTLAVLESFQAKLINKNQQFGYGLQTTSSTLPAVEYKEQLQKKNYAFAYKVIDKATGDDFSHQQFRNSKATNGEYRVKLPDGRIQIVSYKADKNGYNADVKYEEDPEAINRQVVQSPLIPVAQGYVPQNVHINKASVRELVSGSRANFVNKYDFVAQEDDQQLVSPLRNPNLVVLEQAGPTQIPVNYVDVAASPTPSPTHLISEPRRIQPHHPKVQIYTSNPRDYSRENYGSTTAATPTYKQNVIRYTSTPIPPTIQAHLSTNGDNGLFKLNVVSTYASPIHNGPPGHKSIINTVVPSNNPNDAYRHTLEQENELPEGIYIVGKSGKR